MAAYRQEQRGEHVEWGVSGKRVAALLVFMLTLATLLTHEAYVVRPTDPMWSHLAPMRWWLLPHIAGGMIAFLAAPLQFSSTLRRRSPRLHRITGRIYVLACLISSALSLCIVARFEARSNWWVMGAMGGLWFLATACGWAAAVNRDIVQHRLWMGRSFGLTYTFVLTRIVPDALLPGLDHDGVTALYWGFIVVSLILPDFLVNGRALVRRRRHRHGRWRQRAAAAPGDDRGSGSAAPFQPAAA